MRWFLTGFALGWLVGGIYQHRGRSLRAEYANLRSQARGAIDESQRLVAESKRELQAAVSGGSSGNGSSNRGRRRANGHRKPSDES
jgi:hypothetical protein